MRWAFVAAAGLAALACGGLAEPSPPPLFAQLDFEKSYYTDMAQRKTAPQGFQVFFERQCRESKHVGFGVWTSNKESRSFPADRPLFIAATATRGSRECKGYMGFMAKGGGVYAVSLTADDKGCRINVVDKATGEQAPGFRQFDTLAMCPYFMAGRRPPAGETPWKRD